MLEVVLDFLVQIAFHQGSVLSPLFIIVLEALSKGSRSRSPKEQIFSGDL